MTLKVYETVTTLEYSIWNNLNLCFWVIASQNWIQNELFHIPCEVRNFSYNHYTIIFTFRSPNIYTYLGAPMMSSYMFTIDIYFWLLILS